MPLIGTAGHVDHGKSTLVQALTGRDPDRWEEEKRRGLTIDLGFAWTTLPNGIEVSFVDVPGHERYLKNMLAGIEAIDVALFVVAADEGWMPQSEEHLAVLDLLGIHRAVVALTKIDAVDDETTELAALEIQDRLEATSLHDAPIIPVSGLTGLGLERLLETLEDLVAQVEPTGDRPRLWVDRAFSVAGAGTVVTGTLIEGPLQTGQEVTVFPGGARTRIRGIQSHEQDLEVAGPGRRIALSLSGVDKTIVPRGSMLGLADQWVLTRRFTARLVPARYVDVFPERGSFHVHVGSGAHPAEIRVLDGELGLVSIPEGLPLRSGDRFIVRETGRKMVVAGGVVIDPSPPRSRKAILSSPELNPLDTKDSIATALLAGRGLERADRLEAQSGGGHPREAIQVGPLLLTARTFDEYSQDALALVRAHHDEHPLRPGIPIATIATSLKIPPELADRIVEDSVSLVRRGPDVAWVEHREEMTKEMRNLWDEARRRLADSLSVPTVSELGLDQELVHLLGRTGELVRVSADLAYLPEQMAEIRESLTRIGSPFTVAQFRDATGLSRKYAIPILEWADDQGITMRQGDSRIVR
ncbi:MAG: selenocysteine-specific translation elongation factor [Acidimicrobiia bacterium]